MLASTSQVPSGRTPPGPLRMSFGQFIGQAMPVTDSEQPPHIRQSNSRPFAWRSTNATGRSSRS